MCGIAGILRWDGPIGAPEAVIRRMTRRLAHRGPDGEGWWHTAHAALGHRRLAIIDPEGGRQPMASEDGQVHAVHNGELYNYRALTKTLTERGHVFRTRCDSEVAVHAYEEWGTECFARLRGMYAIAIVDERRRRLVLARDPVGIKPLCYRLGAGFVAFASELPALLETDDEPPRGRLAAVEHFLRYQYIPGPETIYEDVHKLEPGSFLEIAFDGTIGPVRRHWSFAFDPDETLGPRAWEERVAAAVAESVRTHLVSDVPFGLLCSGGIDSTLVGLEMAQALDTPVRAFSIGFDDAAHSELDAASAVAAELGFELHTEIVRADALDMLPSLIAHAGEPFGDSSLVPTWHVARLARGHVPMVLSGDGADETFGGYESYRVWMDLPTWGRARRLWPHARRQALLHLARRARAALGGGAAPRLAAWERVIGYFDPAARRALWRPEHHHLVDPPCPTFAAAAEAASGEARLGFAQRVDVATYLPHDILTKVDLASMSHGLEVRTPFVDPEIFALAGRLPAALRMDGPGTARPTLKPLLRRLVADRFPALARRPKQGFAVPRARWFETGAAGDRLYRDVVLDPASPLEAWFDADELRKLPERHGSRRDHSHHLWLLLVLGLWRSQHPDVRFS